MPIGSFSDGELLFCICSAGHLRESILNNDSGCLPKSDGMTIQSAMPMGMKSAQGDLESIVGDASWCKKELNESVGSAGFLPERMPNLVNAGSAPSVQTSSFFPGSSSSNVNHHPKSNKRNPAAVSANLNTAVIADKSASALRHSNISDHFAHAMLFSHPFGTVDMAAVENSRPKRRNVKISKDPQSVAARHRRERISDRIRILQRLVPGGTKMDTASMLDEAIQYVKLLQAQVKTLEAVSNATGGFDPSFSFGPSSMYTGLPGLSYNPMMMDCSVPPQGVSATQSDYHDSREGFPPLSDGNFPVQFCH